MLSFNGLFVRIILCITVHIFIFSFFAQPSNVLSVSVIGVVTSY